MIWHGKAFWVGRKSLGSGCTFLCILCMTNELVGNEDSGTAMAVYFSRNHANDYKNVTAEESLQLHGRITAQASSIEA